MTQQILSTPFGRRSLSFGQLAAQIQIRDVTPENVVHKWKVLQAITTAKNKLSVPDRAIAVLNALLSFHPDTTLSGSEPLIVFPSNEKLASRSHGVAAATLRRHLAILVERGIIIRRDSPNGKRYARRGQGGEISLAYGFDLAPLVARATEFEILAEGVMAERRALRLARERVTLARRDVAKMLAFGLEEALEGPWSDWHAVLLTQLGRIRRYDLANDVTNVAAELEKLALDISKHLESFIKRQNSSANESHFECLKHNSKHKPLDSELAPEGDKANAGETERDLSQSSALHRESLAREEIPPNLHMVLEACPDIDDYALPQDTGTFEKKSGKNIRDWAAFIKTAALVRAMLGISPDAWRDATETMGERDASICVAAILQKGDEINFPGGYLRALTEKKRQKQFSIGPVLMALIGTKLKKRGKSGRD